MNSIEEIQSHILEKLEKGLSPELTYHNVAHTLDVLTHAIDIAALEGIDGAEEIFLLKVSALYHDVGFVNIYRGHEDVSCSIATEELKSFGFGDSMIEMVCGMIMATKVPQRPRNTLDEIICDADLDYLGRTDFWIIGERLYKEFLDQKIVSNYREWNLLQVRFLEDHYYFTASSRQRRQRQKQIHLEAIKAKLA